jgi:CheY-like chemotaxis protein
VAGRARGSSVLKTILLVDDEPIIRNILRCQLSGRYGVFEAASPIEAFDICRSHRDIDLLICDAELGLVSGMELASLLRAWNSKLHTILTTHLPCDHWTQQQEMELAELPADDVLILERPFALSQLMEAIANLLPTQEA